MDQVTVPRELLRQILDYVEKGNPGHIADRINVLVKLRNVLEQPAVEPSAVFYRCNHCGHGYEDQPPSSCDCSTGYGFERVEYFTAPKAQQPNGWIRAVDEEMVSTHLGVADITDSYEDAKRKLNALICWHVDVSHDPKVNGSAQQPPRIGSGVTVEQTLEQWEHDFNNPMTPEQQADWVKREREFASAQAQQPRSTAIAECLQVLRPTVEGKFPQEQALEELVGYLSAPQAQQPRKAVKLTDTQPPCNTHPDAPHGFDRNRSHLLGRYVCDCEGWMP